MGFGIVDVILIGNDVTVWAWLAGMLSGIAAAVGIFAVWM